jgi:hypothetical protein
MLDELKDVRAEANVGSCVRKFKAEFDETAQDDQDMLDMCVSCQLTLLPAASPGPSLSTHMDCFRQYLYANMCSLWKLTPQNLSRYVYDRTLHGERKTIRNNCVSALGSGL